MKRPVVLLIAGRGIKAEFAEANLPLLFELRRVATPFIPAAKLKAGQDILAKANKERREKRIIA